MAAEGIQIHPRVCVLMLAAIEYVDMTVRLAMLAAEMLRCFKRG